MTEASSAPSGYPVADLLEMQRRMLLIRGFEERVAALYRDGEVPGFVHLSTGQEATAVGACWPLGPADVITSTHRGHGHCLAKGLAPVGMFAELMGRDQGTNRGRGGSMHIADPTLGIFGANGIVAAGLPIAAGAAAAAQLRADGSVAVAFFGDGAVAQGGFHEALNLAGVWHSRWSSSARTTGTPNSPRLPPTCGVTRAEGRRLWHPLHRGRRQRRGGDRRAHGQDRRRHPAGGGPAIVEATTYRWHGHYEGDPERYRARRNSRSGGP